VDLTAAGRDASAVVALVAGGLLHLFMGVFVLASGLLAPWWAVILLVAVWLALWLPIWRWRRAHPFRTMLVPFAMAAIWWATITAGDVWLGWTA
jgi:ABC-type uncharacterized transport system permease subunit